MAFIPVFYEIVTQPTFVETLNIDLEFMALEYGILRLVLALLEDLEENSGISIKMAIERFIRALKTYCENRPIHKAMEDCAFAILDAGVENLTPQSLLNILDTIIVSLTNAKDEVDSPNHFSLVFQSYEH